MLQDEKLNGQVSITLVDLLHNSIFSILFNIYSYGAHVISAMATELNDVGFGKIDRLTLLDPGCKVTVCNMKINLELILL